MSEINDRESIKNIEQNDSENVKNTDKSQMIVDKEEKGINTDDIDPDELKKLIDNNLELLEENLDLIEDKEKLDNNLKEENFNNAVIPIKNNQLSFEEIEKLNLQKKKRQDKINDLDEKEYFKIFKK